MNRGRRYGSGRLWQRGRVWVLDFRDEAGARRRVHLGANKRDAERQRVELIARRDRILAGLDTLPQDVPLAELRDRYMADLATRTTPMHVRNVEPVLARWLEALPARTVREVQPADVLAFRARLLSEGRSNRNANYHLACLRALFRWALDVGLISESPIARLKQLPDGPKQQRRRRRAISEDELRRFLCCSSGYQIHPQFGQADPPPGGCELTPVRPSGSRPVRPNGSTLVRPSGST